MTPHAKKPQLVTNPSELRTALAERLGKHPADGASLGLVPTMGALHAGHAALAAAAAAANDVVAATIFVNPLQFGEPADLQRYPRTLEDDVALLGSCGVDIVFAPEVKDVYPGGQPLVTVNAGALGTMFEGAARPGHFDGMLTVVAKLLHLGAPPADAAYRAYFGCKDAQQLILIRRMVHELNFPVEVVGIPTVRDTDGLALSSRNRFLSHADRQSALVLQRALRLLSGRALRREPLDLDSAVALVESAPGVELDYFEVVDPDSLDPLAFNCRQTPFTGEALAIIAARVGPVRLIDNMSLAAG